MSTAVASKTDKQTPTNPMAPTSWEQHQADMEKRQKAREGNQRKLRDCLKADVASQLESLKPTYEWIVEARFDVQGERGLEPFEKKLTVRAQTDSDAWAQFCDKVGHWPGPKACERTITQGAKVN